MDKEQARHLIKETFEKPFNKNQFVIFIKNLLNEYELAEFVLQGNLIKDSFNPYISKYERIGKYYDEEGVVAIETEARRQTLPQIFHMLEGTMTEKDFLLLLLPKACAMRTLCKRRWLPATGTNAGTKSSSGWETCWVRNLNAVPASRPG